MNGTVLVSYKPHELDNRGGLYNGNLDFHLSDGQVDVVVIYIPHKINPIIRIGRHKDLFQG